MCLIELRSTLLGDFLQHLFFGFLLICISRQGRAISVIAACFFLLTILTVFPHQICKTMQVYNINT
jgi:hypothetical protein